MAIDTNRKVPPRRGFGSRLPVTLCAILLFSAQAHAYGDPGSGALLWQLLLAAFFGGMFYFRRIISWVRDKLGRKPEDGEVAGDG
jgi:hypothetical protein